MVSVSKTSNYATMKQDFHDPTLREREEGRGGGLLGVGATTTMVVARSTKEG